MLHGRLRLATPVHCCSPPRVSPQIKLKYSLLPSLQSSPATKRLSCERVCLPLCVQRTSHFHVHSYYYYPYTRPLVTIEQSTTTKPLATATTTTTTAASSAPSRKFTVLPLQVLLLAYDSRPTRLIRLIRLLRPDSPEPPPPPAPLFATWHCRLPPFSHSHPLPHR